MLFVMDALLAFSYSHKQCSCICYQLFTLAGFSISHCHQLQPPAVVPAGCSCCATLLSSVQPAKLLTASVSAQPFLSATCTVFQLCLRSSGDTQDLQQANFLAVSHLCFEIIIIIIYKKKYQKMLFPGSAFGSFIVRCSDQLQHCSLSCHK